jgi:addiction module HigA family antidote
MIFWRRKCGGAAAFPPPYFIRLTCGLAMMRSLHMKSNWQSRMNPSANQWTLHWAIDPGQHLLECIASHGLSTQAFAQHVEIPRATLDAIIAGRHPITYDIALRIERSLGIMPELWFALQSRWERQNKLSRYQPGCALRMTASGRRAADFHAGL